MMKKLPFWLVLSGIVLLSIVFPVTGYAQSSLGVLPILNFPTSVASAGKGNTSLATTPDGLSSFHNNATLAWLVDYDSPNTTIVSTSNRFFNGSHFATASVAHADDNGTNCFFGIRYLYGGSVNGPFVQNNDRSDLVIDAGFALITDNPKWSIGFTARVLNSNVAVNGKELGAISLAGDMALSFNGRDDDKKGLGFTFAVRNIGVPLDYSNGTKPIPLPSEMAWGISYALGKIESGRFEASFDAHKQITRSSTYSARDILTQNLSPGPMLYMTPDYSIGAGLEYSHIVQDSNGSMLFVRGGWITDSVDKRCSGYTYGVGFKFDKIRIDAASFNTSVKGNRDFNTVQFGISFQL